MFRENILVTVPREKTGNLSRVASKMKRAAKGQIEMKIDHPEDWAPDLVVRREGKEFTVTCWETSRGWTYFVADGNGHTVIEDERVLVQTVTGTRKRYKKV